MNIIKYVTRAYLGFSTGVMGALAPEILKKGLLAPEILKKGLLAPSIVSTL